MYFGRSLEIYFFLILLIPKRVVLEISRKNIRAAISPPALSFKKRKSAVLLIKEKKNEEIMIIDPSNVGQEYPCTGRKNKSIRNFK